MENANVHRGKYKIHNEELKDLVVELYKTDMKCEDIARKCNISKTSLFKIIKERW